MLVNDNETFIITGTSRGLGKNLVNYYLNKSKNIIGVSRSSPSISHKNYTHFTLDVSSENDVKELFRNIRKNFQNINCVINNAAVSYSNSILLTPAKEVEHVMKINLVGSFIVIKEAVKLLKKKNCGRIISISSILAKKSLPGTSAYSSSKVALEKFIEIFREEIENLEISLDIINLSAIEGIGMSNEISEDAKKAILMSTSSKKLIKFDDIIREFNKIIVSGKKNLNVVIQ